MITQEEVREAFEYDPETGHLKWGKTNQKRLIGQFAGGKHKGYIRIGFKGKKWGEHQLVFLYHKGYIPEEIDHNNRIKDCNFIENLEDSNRSDQMHNIDVRKDNKLGESNIYMRGEKYCVLMQKGNTRKYQQCNSLEEAIEVRAAFKAELYPA
uniref:Homing endonuclease n=1 Tax=Phage MSP1 TaxID=2801538 RepID=A0AB37G6I3_9VIRU